MLDPVKLVPLAGTALVMVMGLGLVLGSGRTPELSPEASDQPEELGRVRWTRGLEEGLAAAASQQRPALVLFDEVPGCQTVRSYGLRVLSHPLIVEAAETLFVPVVVYNNVPGADREALQSFGEPSWNNPVVRILTPKRKPLAPRLDGDYSLAGLAANMAAALAEANRDVPEYLTLLASAEASLERATFSMYCFWSGEVALGGIEGVVQTRAGFLDHREVVDVDFDPSRVSFPELLSHAARTESAQRVFARSGDQLRQAQDRGVSAQRSDQESSPSPKDTKYRIRATALRYVPMTPTQASRVNAALGNGGDPLVWLSPRQRTLLALVRREADAGWEDVVGRGDLEAAWSDALGIALRVGGS